MPSQTWTYMVIGAVLIFGIVLAEWLVIRRVKSRHRAALTGIVILTAGVMAMMFDSFAMVDSFLRSSSEQVAMPHHVVRQQVTDIEPCECHWTARSTHVDKQCDPPNCDKHSH